MKKSQIIIDMYKMRKCRQEDIARILGININRIRLVTQENGYKNTKEVTPVNRNPDQLIKVITDYHALGCLDGYSLEDMHKKYDEWITNNIK